MAKKKTITPQEGFSEVLRCTTANGQVKVEMYLQNEIIWLSQQKIADLFGLQQPAITKQLKNIFETGELHRKDCLGPFWNIPNNMALLSGTKKLFGIINCYFYNP